MKRKPAQQHSSKRGALGRPVSPQAHGPVFEARLALSKATGRPISRVEFAERIGASESSVTRWELNGAAPTSTAVAANLRRLARQHKIKAQ